MQLLGLLRFTWLKTLNASKRNCAPTRSVMAKFLNSDISELKKLGPVKALRPLPNCASCGRWNGPEVSPLSGMGATGVKKGTLGLSRAAGIEVPDASLETPDQEGPANAHVLVGVALIVAGAPRETATPVGRGIELESADEQIQGSASIAHESLAPSKRQFINKATGEYVLAVEVVRTVVHLRIDVCVSAVVG